MIELYNQNTTDFTYHGVILHECTKAVVKEALNGDFVAKLEYPITNSHRYKKLKTNKIIYLPTPRGNQPFRIYDLEKRNDRIIIEAQHTTFDIMEQLVEPISINNKTCREALDTLFGKMKTPNSKFTWKSEITERHTYNTTEEKTFYSNLMDGKHSIVGTWEGELLRDNFGIEIKKRIGKDTNIVISTSTNLKTFEEKQSSRGVVTKIYGKSTFKANKDDKEDTVLTAVAISSLRNTYPFEREKSYENNNIRSQSELIQWLNNKFNKDHIDKVSSNIKVTHQQLNNRIINLGDTVRIYVAEHDVEVTRKCTEYEYDAIFKRYINVTFGEEKTGITGIGSTHSNSSQEVQNIVSMFPGNSKEFYDNLAELLQENAKKLFEKESGKFLEGIKDSIEKNKSQIELNKAKITDELNRLKVDTSNELSNFNKSLKETKATMDGRNEYYGKQFNALHDDIDRGFHFFEQKFEQRIKRTVDDSMIRTDALRAWTEDLTTSKLTREREEILRIIDNKGYITNTSFSNKFEETAKGIRREISNVDNKVNTLNSWKLVANETLNNVVSKTNDVLTYSQLKITNNGINFGAGQEFNGQKLISMLTVNPGYIKAITEKMIITPANENLVNSDLKNTSFVASNGKMLATEITGINTPAEFLIKGYTQIPSVTILYFSAKVQLKNSNTIHTYTASPYLVNSGNFECSLKIDNVDTDQVKNISFIAYTYSESGAGIVTFKNLAIIQKKSASLLVDGTITSNHLMSKIIKAAHIDTSAIEAIHIKSNSLTADKILVDEAFINKLLVNNLLVDKLTTNYAFITKILATDIDATRIKSGYLSGDRIYGGTIQGVTLQGLNKIKIGERGFMQPIEKGLQINAPASHNANWGVGVQIAGAAYPRAGTGTVPKGLFIYSDDDFDTGGTVTSRNENLITVNGTITCRSLSDGYGNYSWGYAIPTIREFNQGGKGLYPIFDIYHQDNSNGQYLLYTVPGTTFSVDASRISDIRLKTNIKESKIKALNIINQISFKSFDWREAKKGHEKLGMIAQELEKLEPSFVKFITPQRGEGHYALDMATLSTYNLKATQEIDYKFEVKIAELNQKINKLENEIKELRSAA
ncbi:tail fiber domain-containing protein [Gemella sp. 27098_8_92]|uniref:phage tail spike protein n=1 Tax=Gemella sp. 27098_8_92 TaxID=3003687 RepID=UPI00352C0A9C